MIGNETLANEIADATLILDMDDTVDVEHSLIPEGWTYLGSGSYRHAFRGPDGYVYKVNANIERGDWGHNEFAYHKYVELLPLLFGSIRMAECDYFTDSMVMVQEYVDGETMDDWDETLNIGSLARRLSGRFVDCHAGNFRMVDGIAVLIDW